jgi:hypothetical protein
MALRSNASFTKRSVSSRIACFDISRFLVFCAIGHTAGRGPRQRTCWVTIVLIDVLLGHRRLMLPAIGELGSRSPRYISHKPAAALLFRRTSKENSDIAGVLPRPASREHVGRT